MPRATSGTARGVERSDSPALVFVNSLNTPPSSGDASHGWPPTAISVPKAISSAKYKR